MLEKTHFHETYIRAAGAIAYLSVLNAKGDEGIGSAFHIGDGIFITARHVVEGVTINDIATTKSAFLVEEAGGRIAPPRRLRIIDGPYFGPESLDVAAFKVDLNGGPLPAIAVSPHSDYYMDQNDFVLSDILILGYPPVPCTTVPVQVVALGQINAVVRVRHSPALHFLGSAMARGGFSGGVALDRRGIALGVVTESLGKIDMPVETGFMSVLSIEPALELAAAKFGFTTNTGYFGRFGDTLFAVNLSKESDRPLSSFIYDASVDVYDDDHDVLVEINCHDPALLAQAVATFDALTPLRSNALDDGSVAYTPISNPSAESLLAAGEAVAEFFVRSGYRIIASTTNRSRKLR